VVPPSDPLTLDVTGLDEAATIRFAACSDPDYLRDISEAN
jgi:hypothetical protein